MDIERILKRKCLSDGKLFAVSSNSKRPCLLPSLPIPKQRSGFNMEIISMSKMRCQIEIDHRAVVSLALINQHSCVLESYANKLPIMSINVVRLLYTIEAFNMRNQTSINSPTEQALEFYIRTDLKYRNKRLPANRQFSDFLHRLRSSGYTDYIFDLATELNFSVDLITPPLSAVRYTKLGYPIGILTAINDATNNRWYVKTSNKSILV